MNPIIPTLARLARMGPDEIRTRTKQALSKRLDLLNARVGRTPWFAAGPQTGPSSSAAFFEMPVAPPPDLVEEAEKILQHKFDLLGYTNLDFGNPIDWHLDPVHRKQSPRKPWYKIPFLDFAQVGDHKIIWELNRHQHLVTLAQAWHYTKDARFAAEIRAQWQHWQRENPYPIGINWASSLEVAFRALSWLWLLHLLGDFHPDLLPALHLHGWYIERYLSTYFAPNTHLLGEGVALFSIGLLCPQFASASRWRDLGWKIVLRQAEAQVLPDGMHFEQSIYYHVYALDFFVHARTLAERNTIPIPPAFARTIEKMQEALAAISQAGAPPRFGDDDGGRVILPNRAALPCPAPRSVALTSSGIYAMTSADSQLFIDAGPHGVFAGGHGHADALSIQLIANGRDVLIDPGTFCYVCPERDRFRGTAAHNTLQIDGRDQAQPAGPFAWIGMPQTKVDRWHTTDTFDFFAGRHNGYHPIIHHRWVFGLKNKFWLVRDLVTEPNPSGLHRLAINWHFRDENDLTILPPSGHNWKQSIERFDWSPVYGKLEPAQVLKFETETTLPAELVVVISRGAGILACGVPSGPDIPVGANYIHTTADAIHEFAFESNRFCYRATTSEGTNEITL